MDTHYHIWRYVRDEDGTIRFMERDDQVYPKRRQANYALTDGRQYWRAGQVLQCVDGAFCQPLPEEMVDRGMPSLGSKYVAIDQLEEQARSIRPAAKHVKAMKLRDELGAAGRIKKLEAVKVELAEHLAGIDAELARLVRQGEPKQGDTTMSQLVDKDPTAKTCPRCNTINKPTGVVAAVLKKYECGACHLEFVDICEGACDECIRRKVACGDCSRCMFELLPTYFEATHPDSPIYDQ